MGRHFGGSVVATAVAVVTFAALVAPAQAERAFSLRSSTTASGDIVTIGNTNVSCSTLLSTACAAAQSSNQTATTAYNNNFTAANVDVDTDLTTTNSSRATLALPSTATVAFAGLYWGANSTSATRNQVSFRLPGDTAYRTLTATQLDTSGANQYHAFRDVTSLVQTAGNGVYTLANLRTTVGTTNQYGGWTLVVAYRDPTQAARNLTVFDGLQLVDSANPTISIPLSGFRTPPAGTVKTTLGVQSYDGDRGLTGDSLSLASGTGAGTTISDGLHPSTDFFNSTFAREGVYQTAKEPNYSNQLGYDTSIVRTDGILANNATSATIRLTTGGETYYPGIVTFATEVYAPKLDATKSFADIGGGNIEPGDTLTVTINATNSGQDTATGVVLSDPLPAGITYVPGSLSVAGTARTDAAGDDVGEYRAADRTVAARVGTGATATAGGRLAPAATTSVTFRVTVDSGLATGTQIVNQARYDFTGEATGTALQSGDDAQIVVRAPDLALTKSHEGALVRGAENRYVLTARNAGEAPTRGTVTVTDTLPMGVTSTGGPSGTGWSCTVVSRTVTCTRSDALAAGAAYPAITIPVTVAQDAPSALENTASVSGGGQASGANDTATDSANVVDSSDLVVAKTANRGSAAIGDTVVFTVTARNTGPSTATNVVVTDTLPAGMSLVSATTSKGSCTAATCAIGSLTTGETATVTVTARVTSGASGTTQTNSASATADQADPAPGSNTATAAVTVAAEADIALTKTIGTSPVVAGSPVRFRLRAANAGPGEATQVVLTDELPTTVSATGITATPTTGTCTISGRTVRCTVARLASGADASVDIVATVEPTLAGGTLTNAASSTRAERDPSSGNDSATASAPITGSADLAIDLTDTTDPIAPGAQQSVVATVTNAGPSTAVGARAVVTLAEGVTPGPLPSGCTVAGRVVTCELGTLAPGATAIRTIPGTVDPAATGTLRTTGRVSATTADPTAANDTDTEDTRLVGSADLRLGKTASTSTVAAGDTVVYTLTASNSGPSTARDVVLTDTLPAGQSLVGAEGATCTSAVSCPLGDLAPGATRIVRLTVRIAADRAAGTQVNSAAISSSTADPDSASNTATASVTIAPRADLRMTKAASAPTPAAGDTVTYTLTATNDGPSVARSAVVSDTLPAALTFVDATAPCTASGQVVTCALGDLAPAAVRTLTLRARIAPTTASGALANVARITSATTDPDATNDSGTAVVQVTPSADVQIEIAQSPNPAVAGGPIAYTLTVRNSGPSTARAVVVSDPLPASVTVTQASLPAGCTLSGRTVTCTLGDLAPDATRTITLNGTVDPAQSGTLTNTASVSSTTPDPDPTDNSATATSDPVARADLRLDKTASPTTVRPGEDVTYTLTLSNAGPSTASGVQIVDELDAALAVRSVTPAAGCSTSGQRVTCARTSLAPGASTAVTIVARLAPGTPAGTVPNAATATSSTTDPTPDDARSSAAITASPAADLTVVKSADPARIVAGRPVTYTIAVSSAGPSTARAVRVRDTLPTALQNPVVTPSAECTLTGREVDCALGDLAASGTRTVTVSGTAASDLGSASLVNTATVSSATPDPDAAGNTSTVTSPVDTAAALVLTKTATPSRVVPGRALSYRLVARNDGPSAARNVVLDDPLPTALAGPTVTPSDVCSITDGRVRCSFGSLAAGGERVVTVNGTADAGTTDPIRNSASLSSDTPQASGASPTAVVTSEVDPLADLGLVMVADPEQIVAGQATTFRLTVTNTGPSTARIVEITDPLPAGLTPVVVGTSALCAPSGTTVRCALGDLAPGASRTVEIRATTDPATALTSATNRAVVSSSTPDADSANDAASATVTIGRSADLVLTKRAAPTVAVAGEPLTYTLTARNAGPSVAAAVRLRDPLPAGVTLVGIDGATGCSTGGGTVDCPLGDLAPGATVTVTIRTTVDGAATSALVNTASLATATPDPSPADASDTVTSSLSTRADLSLEKTAPAEVDAGGAITYVVTARNAGPSTARRVVVRDPLPDGLVGASATVDGRDCTLNGREVVCAAGDIAAGASAVVTVRATVAPDASGSLDNTAGVTSDTADPTPADTTASASSTVRRTADLRLEKRLGGTATAGRDVTWTLALTNAGSGSATNVVVTDRLPDSVTARSVDPSSACTVTGRDVRCAFDRIGPGVTRTITIVAALGADARGTLANSASATATEPDPSPGDATSSTTDTIVGSANLSVDIAERPEVLVLGGDVTYTFTTRNGGPSSARDSVLVADLPASVTGITVLTPGADCALAGRRVTCNLGLLAPGAVLPIEIRATIPALTLFPLTTTATVSSSTPDPQPADNTDTETSNGVSLADLRITKTASGTPRAGEPLSYTLQIDNGGLSAAQDVVVSDPLPDGFNATSVRYGASTGALVDGPDCSLSAGNAVCRFATHNPGQTRFVRITGTVSPARTGTLSNTATVRSSTDDTNSSNNSATSSAAVVAQADLRVTNSGPAAATPGTTISWTITVSNAGPAVARDVALSDLVPAGVTLTDATGEDCDVTDDLACTLGDLPPGATRTITLTGAIDPAARGSVDTTATATSATADPTPADATDQESTPLIPAADLVTTKTASPATAVPGQALDFTVEVANRGPSTATSVTLGDPLDERLEILGTTPGTPTCSVGVDRRLTCALGTIAPGSTATAVVRTRLRADAGSAAVVNVATATATETDPTPDDGTGSVTVPSAPRADLRLVKTAGSDTGRAGEDITYTLAVTNDGPSTARSVRLSDDLPEGLSVDRVTPASDCSGTSGRTVRCALGDVADGATRTVTVVARTSSRLTGAVVNTASVSGDTVDPDDTDDTASATVTLRRSADVGVVASADAATATAGRPASFTVTVRNAGPSTASGVRTRIPLPDGLRVTEVAAPCDMGTTEITCALGDLEPGEERVLEVTGDVDPTFSGPLRLVASISSEGAADPVAANDSDDASTEVTRRSEVRVTKRASGSAVAAGEAITWTVDTAVDGPSSADDVTVTDTVPATAPITSIAGEDCTRAGQVVTCTYGRLAAGARRTLEITARVSADADLGPLANTATVTTSTAQSDTTDDRDTASTQVAGSADLVLRKSVSPDRVVAGGPATFRLVVRNDGPSVARSVVLDDVLPASLTAGTVTPSQGSCSGRVECALGTLDVGATATVDIAVTAPATPTDETVTNTATVRSAQSDPTPDDARDSAALRVTAEADLTVAKRLLTTPPRTDAPVAYELAVTSAGPSQATGVVLTDQLPAALRAPRASVTSGSATCAIAAGVLRCERSALAAGEGFTVRLEADLDPAAGGATLTNTAAVTADQPDRAPAGNQSTASALVLPASDLSLTKTADAARVEPGSTLGYTLTARNAGPSPDTGVRIVDTLPAGTSLRSADPGCTAAGRVVTCVIGDLPVGTPAARRIVVDVPVALAGSTITNVAEVTGDVGDPVAANDAASAATDVGEVADLSLRKTVSPGATAGSTAVFSLTVANAGPALARGVDLTDPLPAGTRFVSATPSQGSCRDDAGTVRCALGDVAPSAGATVQVVVQLDASLGGSTLSNTASVRAAGPGDPTPADATSTATTPVAAAPAPAPDPTPTPTPEPAPEATPAPTPAAPAAPAILEVTKRGATAATQARVPFEWTITVRNTGGSTAADTTVIDPLPPGVTLVDARSTRGRCSGTTEVRCAVGDLAPGASETVTLRVQADQPGPLRNVASASTSSPVAAPTDMTAVAGVDITLAPESLLDAAALEASCQTRRLVLTDVVPIGRRVRLIGSAGAVNAGKRVSLVFRATGKVVARPTVQRDGRFTATAPLPSARLRSSNLARYQARLGKERSLDLKLARRMRTTQLTHSRGTVTMKGSVALPLARTGATVVTIKRRIACGKYQTVARVKTDRRGRFTARIKAPAGVRAAIYRAQTSVPKTRRNPKKFPTFTLPRGVDLK